MEKRLSAILAADMVGYSRLMEADETGTLERQKRFRKELIDPMIRHHNGRIVKLMGDGMLAEFASVTEAVECSVAIQNDMAKHDTDPVEENRIRYRVAVNLGDILHDDGDVFGSGVNIAARLEELSDPGGVCISGTAFDHLPVQLQSQFQSLGDVSLKNIERGVRAYKSKVLGGTASASDGEKGVLEFRLPIRPRILVTEFTELSDQASEAHLGVALRDSVLASLSSSMRARVFSTASIEPQVTSGKHSYKVAGSVQIVGGRTRVNVKLVDANGEGTIWAEQFDFSDADSFAVQDGISQNVRSAVDFFLIAGESSHKGRGAGFPMYQKNVEGRVAMHEFTPDGLARAERAWGVVYENNPNSSLPNTLVGWLHWQRSLHTDAIDRLRQLEAAKGFVEKAGNFDETAEERAARLILKAVLCIEERHFDGVEELVSKAVAADPFGVDVMALAGYLNFLCGRTSDATAYFRRAMRLEPVYPGYVAVHYVMALARNGQQEEALAVSQSILEADFHAIEKTWVAAYAAVILTLMERKSEAKDMISRLLAINPDWTTDHWVFLSRNHKDRGYVENATRALMEAGLPDA